MSIEHRAHLLQIREFKADPDYAMVCQWFEEHKKREAFNETLVAPPLEWLPPIGIIVYRTDGFHQEDMGALWLYLAAGSPVCFVEHVITKPGLRFATAALALMEAQKYLKGLALSMGYKLMIAHTLLPIARYLKRDNWHEGERDMVTMYTSTLA